MFPSKHDLLITIFTVITVILWILIVFKMSVNLNSFTFKCHLNSAKYEFNDENDDKLFPNVFCFTIMLIFFYVLRMYSSNFILFDDYLYYTSKI